MRGLLLPVTAILLAACTSTSDVPQSDGAGGGAGTSSEAGTGGSAGGSTACPETMPALGSDCSFTGDTDFGGTPVCVYEDPTDKSPTGCLWYLGCPAGKVGSAGMLLFGLGCPTEVPVDGDSCTCGEHLWGEASSPSTGTGPASGVCAYPCDGGIILAHCSNGKLAAEAPGSVRWKVDSCGQVEPPDAGHDAPSGD